MAIDEGTEHMGAVEFQGGEGRREPSFSDLNATSIAMLIEKAVAKEREACAQVCDRWAAANIEAFRDQALAAECCARRIRKRGSKCEGCDGRGVYMVNAHGPQEVKCGECGGTGVSGYGSPESTM